MCSQEACRSDQDFTVLEERSRGKNEEGADLYGPGAWKAERMMRQENVWESEDWCGLYTSVEASIDRCLS